MPELSEVETVKNVLLKKLKGKKIKEVVVDDKDRFLFAFAKPKDVEKALVGAKVTGAGRKGKYFWLEFDRKPWPIFHLGMSGNISITEPKGAKKTKDIWEGIKLNSTEPLWFCRLLLVFEKGYEMGFLDPRRFGRMWLTDDPWKNSRISKLGYDPLIDFPTSKKLGERLSKRKRAIKSVLLDQSLFAGIGNWLADEILYHAKISPHRLAADLKSNEVTRLHNQTLAVVKKAVAVSADYHHFPENWLFHHRWGKVKNSQTSRRHKIIHEDIGGRTTAWVPGWQK